MVFGILFVVLLFSLYAHVVTPSPDYAPVLRALAAKDEAMAWFYGASVSTESIPANVPFACDVGFRPQVTAVPLDPSDDASWISQTLCVGAP